MLENKALWTNVLDFVEDDAGRLVDAEQANNHTNHRNQGHDLVVRHREQEDIVVLDALRPIVIFALCGLRLRLGLAGGGSLALRRRGGFSG